MVGSFFRASLVGQQRESWKVRPKVPWVPCEQGAEALREGSDHQICDRPSR